MSRDLPAAYRRVARLRFVQRVAVGVCIALVMYVVRAVLHG